MRDRELLQDEELWKITDVANFLGVQPQTVYVWVQQGKIPFYKVNGFALRFEKTRIARWLEAQKHEPAAS